MTDKHRLFFLSPILERGAPWLLACFLAAFAILQLKHLSLLYFGDEITSYAIPAQYLVRNGLQSAHPAFRSDPSLFFGHPPLYHFSLAIIFKLFGEGPLAPRAASLTLALISLVFCYRAVKQESNSSYALMAVLVVLIQPAFWGLGTRLTYELATAALLPIALFYYLKGNFLAYSLLASCAVLCKETALALPAAIFITHVLSPQKKMGKNVVWLLFPLLALGAFFLDEKIFTGSAVNWRSNELNTLISFAPNKLVANTFYAFLVFVWRWPLNQFLFLVTALNIAYYITCFILYKRNHFKTARFSAHLSLLYFFLYIVGHSICRDITWFYSINIIIPITIAAFLFTNHTFKESKKVALGLTCIAILICLVPPKFFSESSVDGYNDNLFILSHLTEATKEAAQYLEATHANSEICALWPIDAALTAPVAGFVTNSLNASRNCSDTMQLFVYSKSSQASDFYRERPAKKILEKYPLKMIKHFQVEDAIVQVWAK